MIAKVGSIYRPMFKNHEQKESDYTKKQGTGRSFKDLLNSVLKKSSGEKV